MNNLEINQAIFENWELIRDYHRFSGNITDNLIKNLFLRKSTDNLSVILITFENFYKNYERF